MLIQVAGLIDDSRVNGPGRRVVVWVQGCTLGCLGCFNPGTHAAGVSGVAVEAAMVAAAGMTVVFAARMATVPAVVDVGAAAVAMVVVATATEAGQPDAMSG